MSREVKVGNEWVRVAGRGKAEYGASHCQTGTQNLTQSVDAWKSSVITLSEAMPDSDYCVDFTVTGSNLLGIVQLPVVIAKTASTFTVGWINDTSKVGASDVLRIDYKAFKLYSDKEYDGLLDDVAENKTDIATLKSEMETVTSGTTSGTLALTWERVGKLVTVFGFVQITETTSISADGILATGLPRPNSAVTHDVPLFMYGNMSVVADMYLSASQTVLRTRGSLALSGRYFTSFTYIAA